MPVIVEAPLSITLVAAAWTPLVTVLAYVTVTQSKITVVVVIMTPRMTVCRTVQASGVVSLWRTHVASVTQTSQTIVNVLATTTALRGSSVKRASVS